MCGGGRRDSSGIREEGKVKNGLEKGRFFAGFYGGGFPQGRGRGLSTRAGQEAVRRNKRSAGVCKKGQRVSLKSTAHRRTGEKQSGIAAIEEYL